MNGILRRSPTAWTLGLGLIVLLLAANGLVSEWNLRRLVDNEDRVLHTQRVLTTLEEVLARVTGAETAERGYLITGDASYLEPYRKAVRRSLETLDRLTGLTQDEPAQQARIAPLRRRVDDRMDELRRAIAARQEGGFDAARQSVSTNHGRQLMNEMRALVREMRGAEEESLALRAAESARSVRMARVADLVGNTLGVGLVGLAFYLFRRELAVRKRAEEVARRLAAIVESSQDAIVSKTLDGVIVSWNAGAQRLYGYRPDEVVGRPIAVLCPPERLGDIDEKMERVRRGVHIEHFETTRICKDGRRIDVSLSISPIKDAAGRVVGASSIARDITERKTLQREVLEIAGREQRRIGQDLHDGIGQELTGLAMLGQRLAGLLGEKGLAEAESAAKIAGGLEQALRQVRALSRGLVPVELDAEGLTFALAELARRTSELNGITCTFRCGEPVAIPDNQAATHLYRMSQEALTNAVKHGRARNVLIRLAAPDGRARLEITDDGVGFAEPSADTGTGLRIMRYRAELIGARLTLEPSDPHGTRVTCTLLNPA
jgi:PAS domain S-box-containing protein